MAAATKDRLVSAIFFTYRGEETAADGKPFIATRRARQGETVALTADEEKRGDDNDALASAAVAAFYAKIDGGKLGPDDTIALAKGDADKAQDVLKAEVLGPHRPLVVEALTELAGGTASVAL